MFFNHSRSKKRAFTLAEVLITLTIIGIIAALTIPTLVTDYNRRVWETKLKKDYAIATNMCERMLTDENAESITELNLYTRLANNNVENIEQTIKPYVDLTSAMAPAAVPNVNGYSMNIPDGSIMYISRVNGRVAIRFYVDVNGAQNPNIPGRDIFAFNLGSDCGYTETGHANNNSYGTFRNAMRNEWRLPRNPVGWGG